MKPTSEQLVIHGEHSEQTRNSPAKRSCDACRCVGAYYADRPAEVAMGLRIKSALASVARMAREASDRANGTEHAFAAEAIALMLGHLATDDLEHLDETLAMVDSAELHSSWEEVSR
jgi:hypothetical protein